MNRLNSEGYPRHQLLQVMRERRIVMDARRIDACLLCRRNKVNESGLCEVCYGMLDGEELRLAERWRSGVGP